MGFWWPACIFLRVTIVFLFLSLIPVSPPVHPANGLTQAGRDAVQRSSPRGPATPVPEWGGGHVVEVDHLWCSHVLQHQMGVRRYGSYFQTEKPSQEKGMSITYTHEIVQYNKVKVESDVSVNEWLEQHVLLSSVKSFCHQLWLISPGRAGDEEDWCGGGETNRLWDEHCISTSRSTNYEGNICNPQSSRWRKTHVPLPLHAPWQEQKTESHSLLSFCRCPGET